ncbi:hypothetical protein EVG20_g10771 [Dentipellis fragilis]|uniref:Uncharacterized protein n=1 Tax=Dentipellis fragilis TaxID=205917 RepID=A0A4Y9XRD5_9AGAM|nr:hypothetical protein EVG20_g10771 [Dentipellis fragilis]
MANSDLPDIPLIPIDLPARDARLPQLYKALDHPRHPSVIAAGRTYLYHVQTSDEGRRLMEETLANLTADQSGSYQDRLHAGILQVKPGDMVFSRKEDEPNKTGMADFFQVLVGDRRLWTAEQIAALVALREDILGPREFRTAEKPSRDPQTGLLAGGTAYERTGVLSGKDRGRAYNVGQMKQAQRGVIAPSSNVKAVHDPTPQQKDKDALQSRLIHISTEVAMQSLQYVTDCEEIRNYRDVVCAPIIGHESNCMFDSLQVNVSPATCEDDETIHTEDTLGNSDMLGRSGAEHVDHHDYLGSYSSMLSLSDCPHNWEPARLEITGMGIFVLLTDMTGMIFSGRHKHCPSSIRRPQDAPPAPWAYRLNIILYPAETVAKSDGVVPLAAFPMPKGDGNNNRLSRPYLPTVPWLLAPGQVAPVIQGHSPIPLAVYGDGHEFQNEWPSSNEHFDHTPGVPELPSLLVEAAVFGGIQGPGGRLSNKGTAVSRPSKATPATGATLTEAVGQYRKKQLLPIPTAASRSKVSNVIQQSALHVSGLSDKGKKCAHDTIPVTRTTHKRARITYTDHPSQLLVYRI